MFSMWSRNRNLSKVGTGTFQKLEQHCFDGITYVIGSTWLIAFVRRRDECDCGRGEPGGRQEVPLTRHQVLLASRKTQLLTFFSTGISLFQSLGAADPTIQHWIVSKTWNLSKNHLYLLLH